MKHITEQPSYAAAAKARDEVVGALAKVEARITELEALMQQPVPPSLRESSRVSAALHFARTGEVKAPSGDPSELREEHVMQREMRDALQEALRARREELSTIEGTLSAEASAALGAKHKDLVKRYASKLKELDALWQEEEDLMNSLHNKGYRGRFSTYIRWPLIGRLGDRSSMVFMHFREITGYIPTASPAP